MASCSNRSRCVVDQPTCETVKVSIVDVHLAFTDHPNRLEETNLHHASQPQHELHLRNQANLRARKPSHSPGQRETAHAFRAREHSGVGLRRRLLAGCSEQAFHLRDEPSQRPDAKDTSCTLHPCIALARAEPPQLRPLSKCESHILNTALTLHLTMWSPPRCASSHNCDASPSPSRLVRSVRATVAVEFSTFPPPVSSQAKRSCVQRPCLPAAAALPVSKEMGLHRNRQSVVACNRRPRVETALP